jgi:hypothetical protein
LVRPCCACGVAYFSGTAWRFLPIKRAPRGSFDCAEWRVWQAPLLILSVDLAIYLVRTPLTEP